MKLRNKKTGEIKEVRMSYREDTAPIVVSETTCDENGQSQGWPYNSLAELNEEWEDAPEGPETHWMIDTSVLEPVREIAGNPYEINKEIGNWFSSKEEAEKAVEKLKALTEAKKDGLVIKGYYYNHDDLVVLADIGNCNKLTLDTLFGKEID